MARTTPLALLVCGAALLACGRDGSAQPARTARSALDTTPPAVASTSPANGATGISIDTVVAATFSEAMDETSLDAGTFALAGPSGPIPGAVFYDTATRTAELVPAAMLAVNTVYTATIGGVRDQAGNFMRGTVTWSFTTARAETTPPAVVSTIPASGDTFPPNGALVATFSESMDAATISSTTFTVTAAGGSTPVSATVQYDGASRSAILYPATPLAPGTSYTATVTTGVRDLAQNGLAQEVSWTFTTGNDPDSVQPTVTATAPAGANISAGTPITAAFSEAVDPRTVTTATFTLQGPSSPVAGSVSYDPVSRTATFTPVAALPLGRTYTAIVTTGVRDLAGNPLAAPATWTFTLAVRYTGLVSNYYFDHDGHVRTNVNAWWGGRPDRGLRLSWVVAQEGDHWRYTYSVYGSDKGTEKWIDALTIGTPDDFASTDLMGGWSLLEPVGGVLTDVTWILTRPGAAQQHTSPYGPSVFGIRWEMATHFDPGGGPGTMLILTFSTRRAPTWGDFYVTSPVVSGGGLPTACNWHLGDWTDAAIAGGNNGGWVLVPGVPGADADPPHVLIFQPANGSSGLGVHDSISVSFSEAIDGATASAAGAFTMQDGQGNPVIGTVSYDPLLYIATFTPVVPLSYSTTYTATVSGVSDLAGHAMAAPATWTFTTADPDTTLPRVLSTDPADGATSVAVSAAIGASFSKAIDPANLASQFSLVDASGAVSGAVTYGSATNTATFTPGAPLAYSTTYTATVSGIVDLSGNVMLGTHTWSFTTAGPPPYVPTGDVNGDGIVDVDDARLALRIAAHQVAPDAEQLRRGDVAPLANGAPAPDGRIDVGDVLVILSEIAGDVSW